MKNGLTKEEVLRRVSANAGMEAAYRERGASHNL